MITQKRLIKTIPYSEVCYLSLRYGITIPRTRTAKYYTGNANSIYASRLWK